MSLELVFCDLNETVVEAMLPVGHELDFEVRQGSILEVEADALVSPANSFGFMDGGIDAIYSEWFGTGLQVQVQNLIGAEHHGELLVGQAMCVPTLHDRHPHLIVAPTMRVPMVLPSTSIAAYHALRGVLRCVDEANVAPDGPPVRDVVRRLAFPGLGTGVGGMPPAVHARQIRRAVLDHRRPPRHRHWQVAWDAHLAMTHTPPESHI